MRAIPPGSTRKLTPVLPIVAALVLGAGCTDGSSDSPPAASQSPLTVEPSEHRLKGGGRFFTAPDGKRIPVNPKLVTGYVDAATLNAKSIDLGGWAAPADLSQPAGFVLAVVRQKIVTALKPSLERSDLVEGYDRPGLELSGFVMSVPISSLDCSAPKQGLRIFGVVGEAAGPLEWLGNVGERVRAACRR